MKEKNILMTTTTHHEVDWEVDPRPHTEEDVRIFAEIFRRELKARKESQKKVKR